ncbi:MAG TPA: phosphotransferase family protein, partial [Acidimicrobiales bacterium]
MSEIAELSEAVGQVLSALVGRPASVSNMERLSGGASRVTWSVDAIVDDDPLPLILQRTRGGGSPTGIGAATEAALLRAAHAAGVPTAEVVAAVGDPGLDGPALAGALEVLGDGWVLQARLAGETRPARLLRDEDWAEARAALVAECGAALAAIHRIPAASVPGLEPGDRLVRFRDVLDGFDEPRPAFELGLRWLAAHQPVGRPTASVVHGDFRTGNLLVDRRGLAAVLDWELAHLGDPIEDLGWFCVRAWRFGSPKPAGGFGTRARLVAAYEAHGGGPVDPAVLHW